MQPLNPFLAAFSKSSIAAHCIPVRQHILLVPSTDVLLDSRDTESGAPLTDSIASDEFLGSHVLHVPCPEAVAGGRPEAPVHNLREMKGKARLYLTINGRSIVFRDNQVFGKKGFRNLSQATLLGDAIWYADTHEPTPFLIYYISRPLVGSWSDSSTEQAEHALGRKRGSPGSRVAVVPAVWKKEIKNFHELLRHFPLIARQMQPGLEKLFREFATVYERRLPRPASAVDRPDVQPDGPITTAMPRARSNSRGLHRPCQTPSVDTGAEPFFEDDEEAMKTFLETTVTTAIDLFQSVDKVQLSHVGATTDLTGPLVERLIERYVTETVHHLVFPRLSALKRQADRELEAKIRQMEFIDISQLGIAIDGGLRAKRHLLARLRPAMDEFRKMGLASSPHEMLDVLLACMQAVTRVADAPPQGLWQSAADETIMAVNADTLVSWLLHVVIRAQMKHLQARLVYMRSFIFIDDVESGELGYALSTFEAVLSYLDSDSRGLRRASRRNKALWDTVCEGNTAGLKMMMEPVSDAEASEYAAAESHPCLQGASGSSWASTTVFSVSERFSMGSGLGHVFPFQDAAGEVGERQAKKKKRVTMDTRSMSSGSEISFHSRTASFATLASALQGDTSIERLAQTQDLKGESLLMMAIQNGKVATLRYLLSLGAYFSVDFVLEDANNSGTTLLSAAVQLGHDELIHTLLDLLLEATNEDVFRRHVAVQDAYGRSAAHYLFHAPFLIRQIGHLLPWRQKDKNGQTPLFALCRSYDHATYSAMVEEALGFAARVQGDGERLQLDDHVDQRGNTLLHIVNNGGLAMRIMQQCDVDVNATNEKKFTPLMVASKYGRFDMVRVLFGDARVDVAAREMRGWTAVELAKDDHVRNKMDDLTLFALPPGPDLRTTGVVRSYLVEDASIRFVLKSVAPVGKQSYVVTTCKRSLTDFAQLMRMLELEHPASWIPSMDQLRTPTQIMSRPSRSVLRDLQLRMDWTVRVLLAHPTFMTHEMLWEFFLVPELQPDAMEQRSRLKAEIRLEKIREELEPMEDASEVDQFVSHARDMVRSEHVATRSVARQANLVGHAALDIYDATQLLARHVGMLGGLPAAHAHAFDTYMHSLMPAQIHPAAAFHSTLLALCRNTEAVLKALARPPKLMAAIAAARREAERSHGFANRSSRWPLGMLDDTRQRLSEQRRTRAEADATNLARELRYMQQTVAGELAGWRDIHERMGRRAIRDFATGMLVAERLRMEGLRRALRKIRVGNMAVGYGHANRGAFSTSASSSLSANPPSSTWPHLQESGRGKMHTYATPPPGERATV